MIIIEHKTEDTETSKQQKYRKFGKMEIMVTRCKHKKWYNYKAIVTRKWKNYYKYIETSKQKQYKKM